MITSCSGKKFGMLCRFGLSALVVRVTLSCTLDRAFRRILASVTATVQPSRNDRCLFSAFGRGVESKQPVHEIRWVELCFISSLCAVAVSGHSLDQSIAFPGH